MTRVLMIDNYDSFTYNIYQYLCQLGAQVEVYRNDQITIEECIRLNPERIVISPGPGHPRDAKVSKDVLAHFAGKIPILGVCLGHQAIYEMYGGVVAGAGEIMHGKQSLVYHDGKGVYAGIPSPYNAVRYHSLAGIRDTLPEDLLVTSETANKIIMGVRHKKYTVEGVQFHPESIKSDHGMKLLENFLQIQGGEWPI